MTNAIAFVAAHKVAIASLAYAVLNLINGLISNPEAKSIVGKLIDLVAFLTRGDADGTIKSPLTMSRKVVLPAIPAVTAAADSAVSMRSLALLPLAFIALTLSACAGAKVWSACTLGQLPSVAQPLIVDVTNDLGGLSETAAIQQIEALGATLAPGQMACIVQAIVADIAASKSSLSERGAAIIHNGNAYLAKHPACCGVKK